MPLVRLRKNCPPRCACAISPKARARSPPNGGFTASCTGKTIAHAMRTDAHAWERSAVLDGTGCVRVLPPVQDGVPGKTRTRLTPPPPHAASPGPGRWAQAGAGFRPKAPEAPPPSLPARPPPGRPAAPPARPGGSGRSARARRRGPPGPPPREGQGPVEHPAIGHHPELGRAHGAHLGGQGRGQGDELPPWAHSSTSTSSSSGRGRGAVMRKTRPQALGPPPPGRVRVLPVLAMGKPLPNAHGVFPLQKGVPRGGVRGRAHGVRVGFPRTGGRFPRFLRGTRTRFGGERARTFPR